MVNQALVNYLSQNRNFPLFELKNKVLSSGYNEAEFNEAINLLGLNNPINPKKNYLWWMIVVVMIVIFILWTIIAFLLIE